jgi:hypothetical protein
MAVSIMQNMVGHGRTPLDRETLAAVLGYVLPINSNNQCLEAPLNG